MTDSDWGMPCGCHHCKSFAASLVKNPITKMAVMGGMILCPICGNKRCPHATAHHLGCTGSNEPGQVGSVYG